MWARTEIQTEYRKCKIKNKRQKTKKNASQMPCLLPAITHTVAMRHKQQPFTLSKLRINFRIIWRHTAEHSPPLTAVYACHHAFQNNSRPCSPVCMFVSRYVCLWVHLKPLDCITVHRCFGSYARAHPSSFVHLNSSSWNDDTTTNYDNSTNVQWW